MFLYFPGNYVWNLSVCIALESGAQIGEIDDMCAPLRDAAQRGEDAGTGEFLASWVRKADQLVITSRFRFTRDEGLETSLTSSTDR